MTGRVDFYVLKGAATRERLHFACRLTEKAYQRGLRVRILADSAPELADLDELLWTFSERAFVPHQIGTLPADAAIPVLLVEALPTGSPVDADLLLNLSSRVPADPLRFARIAEVVDADPERRRLGRERFKAYRDLQLTLETHQLDDSAVLGPGP